MTSRLKLFFDGGCRPMPIGMETAVVVRGERHIRRGLGAGSSMEAEWLALIDAMRIVRAQDMRDVLILGDSINVINQANGTARCRGDSLHHLHAFQTLAAAGDPPRLRHIKRAQNLAGIALESRYR